MKTLNIKTAISLTIVLLIPLLSFGQYYQSGGYQGGGHGSGGILTDIEEIVNPVEDISLDTYPNPFSENTQLKFNLHENSWVKVEVYDISGRLIKTILSNKDLSPGEYQYEWTGESQKGNAVTKGVYYYRIQVNSRIFNSKIIRM